MGNLARCECNIISPIWLTISFPALFPSVAIWLHPQRKVVASATKSFAARAGFGQERASISGRPVAIGPIPLGHEDLTSWITGGCGA
jgi:hypothetical protein